MLAYRDTRGLDGSRPRFSDVILRGIASGGGLYVPERLPELPAGWMHRWRDMPYARRALEVLQAFETGLPDDALVRAAGEAYEQGFDDPAVAPVRKVAPGRYVLELFHGPTSAFKDMALQLMPALFEEALRAKRAAGVDTGEYLILVATSGDTGKAALEGYRDREFVRIAVLYPKGGVSKLQELQMLTQEGANVVVFGIRGDFDDAQAAAKATFADEVFAARLAGHGLSLSSANSINWGRVLPQIVYYTSAYVDLCGGTADAAGPASSLAEGSPIDVAVPTGNFGNILAAYYARAMGVPIRRLICASNENSVLADFITDGVYEVSGRKLVSTPSPSMDILVSSNLERLLFDAASRAAGDDRMAAAAAVRGWMTQLGRLGRFEVDPETMELIRDVFEGGYVTNDDTLETIRDVHERFGYLMDPHTAVAWRLAERFANDVPVVVVSTAHWAKFGADVLKALTGARYEDRLSADLERLGPIEALERVSDLAGGLPIPRSLAELEGKPVRFEVVVDADPASVQAALMRAVEAWEADDKTPA